MASVNSPSVYCELICLVGSEDWKTFTKANIRIGRQGDNDFVVPHGGVSRIHAEVVWDEGVWKIRNLNPANRITVNKQDIGQEAVLHHFDEIGLGWSSQALIRFLEYPYRADPPDPELETTLYLSRSTLDVLLSGEEQKHDDRSQGGLCNSQEALWQFVSFIATVVSAVIASYALGPAMLVPGMITLFVGIMLCIGIVIFWRKGSVSFSCVWARFSVMRKKTSVK
jgi:hypothetical protein